MRFDVIESFVRGKWDVPSRCEDIIVLTDHFAAIIDGATERRSGHSIAGLSPGRFAALAGKSAVQALQADATAREAVAHMSYHLIDSLAAAGVPVSAHSRAAFGFVAYSAARREVWRVADCYFAWDGYVNAPRLKSEQVPIEARAMLLHSLILSGVDSATLLTDDPSAQVIGPLIEAQAAMRNRSGTPWSFGAITGQPVPVQFVEVFAVPENVHEIILASDGWPVLCSTLSESEAVLEQTLRDDPLMIRLFPAIKGLATGAISFDDRAYLRLKV